MDHTVAKGGQGDVWCLVRGGICIYKGNDSCVKTTLAVVCTFFDLIPDRLGEGARDPSYFKRAGKRRTEGVIRKFRRC